MNDFDSKDSLQLFKLFPKDVVALAGFPFFADALLSGVGVPDDPVSFGPTREIQNSLLLFVLPSLLPVNCSLQRAPFFHLLLLAHCALK